MAASNVRSDNSRDISNFFLETALVVAGITAATVIAKPLAKRMLTNAVAKEVSDEVLANTYIKAEVLGFLAAPLGAAVGEALYQNSSPFLFNQKPHQSNAFTVGVWGLIGRLNKSFIPLCNSGIAITTALTVGLLSLTYYCHSESDSNYPSIARDMGIAFFIGFATSAALRGRWALVG